ncbi:hypothetical protein LJB90_03855 [Eubacteriales bacterium OttesenSCG-928-G02]|nr:hypothetical protein [Eubacteriales bacterium OttesenSCG-928-G02]
MKRSIILCLLCVLALTLLLNACTETNTSNEESSITPEESSEPNNTIKYKREGYEMIIKTNPDGTQEINISMEEDKKIAPKANQPFTNLFTNTPINLTLDPTKALNHRTNIEYTKRDNGTFIYSNNPEMLQAEDVGVAILRTDNLTGECIFTLEHSNYTGNAMYLGYQLLNTSDTDVTVTITNIGYQVQGEWLGQSSWSDYFNYKFELPFDYFLENGKVNPVYFGCDYIDYTPRIYEAQTFTIPSGEYIYVLGGTSADAYNNINVGNTADKRVEKGKCVNGVVKFSITGGEVQGSLYCYTAASQVQANPAGQGYIVDRNGKNYGAQYKGMDYKQGLIESNLTFIVNDLDTNGRLPVSYTKMQDAAYASKKTPYQKLDLTEKTIRRTNWLTSLNPNYSDAIGTDMSVFNCTDADGNPIVIDTESLDGRGELANIGNWMIQYTDNFTFVNIGDKARTFKVYKKGAASGALFNMVRDYEGNILKAYMKANPYNFSSLNDVFAGIDKSLLVEKNGHFWMTVEGNRPYCDVMDERALCYEVTVQPKSIERISVDTVILGNSNGGITHWVEVTDAE